LEDPGAQKSYPRELGDFHVTDIRVTNDALVLAIDFRAHGKVVLWWAEPCPAQFLRRNNAKAQNSEIAAWKYRLSASDVWE